MAARRHTSEQLTPPPAALRRLALWACAWPVLPTTCLCTWIGISWGYFRDILKIFQGYLGDNFNISLSLRLAWPVSRAAKHLPVSRPAQSLQVQYSPPYLPHNCQPNMRHKLTIWPGKQTFGTNFGCFPISRTPFLQCINCTGSSNRTSSLPGQGCGANWISWSSHLPNWNPTIFSWF